MDKNAKHVAFLSNTAGNTVTIGFHVYDQLIFQIHCSINVHNNGFVPGTTWQVD